MKHIQKMGGAGVVLLTLLCTTFSVSAQTTRYIDPANGTWTGTCTSVDPANANGPCNLARAYALQSGSGDTFLIEVRHAGGTVTLSPPADSLEHPITFGAYKRGATAAVEGTLKFAGSQAFEITRAGQFKLHAKARAQFENVTLRRKTRKFGSFLTHNPRASSLVNFFVSDKESITITGTLTVDHSDAELARLTVSESFKLAGIRSPLRVRELTVNRGATLTIAEGMELHVPMRRGSSATDRKGLLIVDGVIEGAGKLQIRYEKKTSGQPSERGGTDDRFFHNSHEYMPGDGVDHTDCLRVTGSGRIRVQMVVGAAGNVCIDLQDMGSVAATGSINEPANRSGAFTLAADQDSITTDLIFRRAVMVDGDVEQWNDSRIVFEKEATIAGDVILSDTSNLQIHGETSFDTHHTPRTDDLSDNGTLVSVRRGVQMGTSGKYMCDYVTRRTDDKPRAMHIPGVQFAGVARIAGDLDVRSNNLTDGAAADTNPTAPSCAPRVLFLVPMARDQGPPAISLVSSVGGDLDVRADEDFGDKGRVYLDSDSLKTGSVMRRTAHSLRVGRSLVAQGNTIGMGYPATSGLDGMCTGNDVSLTFGNHIVLTGEAKSLVVSDATDGITLGALVTLGDLEIQDGTLTVKTLHVGPRAELTANKNVNVTESLILQGELSGELDEASTIKRLTYGSRATDVVKKVALTSMLDALAIHAGSGELRLDEVVKTKNLGLCSGTLSLVDAESTTDSTLHVTEHITVQNGMLEKGYQ